MTDMSKLCASALAGFLALTSCQDEIAEMIPEPTVYESTSVLKLHPSLLSGGIDWNLSFTLLKSEEVLAEAAKLADTDAQTMEKATSYVADVEESQLRIIARHEEGETAQKFANALAQAFMEAAKEAETERATAQLEKLDLELAAQSEAVKNGRKELFELIEKYDIPYLEDDGNARPVDQDRMTYEKARKALEEEPADDGVLYRKDKE